MESKVLEQPPFKIRWDKEDEILAQRPSIPITGTLFSKKLAIFHTKEQRKMGKLEKKIQEDVKGYFQKICPFYPRIQELAAKRINEEEKKSSSSFLFNSKEKKSVILMKDPKKISGSVWKFQVSIRNVWESR